MCPDTEKPSRKAGPRDQQLRQSIGRQDKRHRTSADRPKLETLAVIKAPAALASQTQGIAQASTTASASRAHQVIA
jgi:hypothetical protein